MQRVNWFLLCTFCTVQQRRITITRPHSSKGFGQLTLHTTESWVNRHTGCIKKNATLAIFHDFKKSTWNSKIWIMSACALGHQLSNHTKHAPTAFRMTDQASFKEKCPKCDLLEVSFPFKIKPRDFSKERMKVSCARDPCGQNDTSYEPTAFRMT